MTDENGRVRGMNDEAPPGHDPYTAYDDFDAEVKGAADALAPLGIQVKRFTIDDAQKNDGPMVSLGLEVKREAAQHASVLTGDLADDLDLTDTATQRKIAQAVGAAEDQLGLGLAGMPTWKQACALSEVFDPDASLHLGAHRN